MKTGLTIVRDNLAKVSKAIDALGRSRVMVGVPADKAALTAAPTSLQLFFSEKPDATVSKIELKGPSGTVKLGPAHVMGGKTLMAPIDGPIGDGSYIVNWQTSGDDGHLQKGEFTFSLKQAH